MAQSIWEEYENLGSSTSHEGAFATVYRVRHKQLGYIRAIRILKEPITDVRDENWKKFLAECQLLLRLGNGGHPNIVRINQPRLIGINALVEMEYVHGKDLNDYLIEKNYFIPIDEVLRFVREISSALAYCHEGIYEFCLDREQDHLQDDPEDGSKVLLDAPTKKRLIEKYKVIHNDIHSKNIIRKYDGSYILLDFGLSFQNGMFVKSSTRKGGASEYKAPEKYDGKKDPNEQTDMYSFGILMYEMLAGQVPFPYNINVSPVTAEYDLMQQHENATPPLIEPLRRAAFEQANPGKKYEIDYPDWLEAIIVKCLEKKPENRYKNGQALFEEIEKNLADSDIIKQLHSKKNLFIQEIAQLKQDNNTFENKIAILTQTISQNKVDSNNRINRLKSENQELQEQLEQTEVKDIIRDEYHGFIKFWLILMIIGNVAILFFTFSGLGFWNDTNYWDYWSNILLKLFEFPNIFCLFNIIAFILLWRKSDNGTMIFFISGIIAIGLIIAALCSSNIIPQKKQMIISGVLEVACVTALFFIMKIKNNGVSGWDNIE
ncbi:hypothetical protein FACS189426_18820 [Bacteroidia bacterium]|nr:hypothetical protein FACS189426_18820 [Bacteroidia bacterium]GHT84303.1 hypothetical protein FACS18947_1560 [Bacteroidia bacterium]